MRGCTHSDPWRCSAPLGCSACPLPNTTRPNMRCEWVDRNRRCWPVDTSGCTRSARSRTGAPKDSGCPCRRRALPDTRSVPAHRSRPPLRRRQAGNGARTHKAASRCRTFHPGRNPCCSAHRSRRQSRRERRGHSVACTNRSPRRGRRSAVDRGRYPCSARRNRRRRRRLRRAGSAVRTRNGQRRSDRLRRGCRESRSRRCRCSCHWNRLVRRGSALPHRGCVRTSLGRRPLPLRRSHRRRARGRRR